MRFGRVGAMHKSPWANLGTHHEELLRNFSTMTMLRSFVGLAVLLLPFVAADADHLKPTPTTTSISTKSTSIAELNLLAKLEGKLYFGTATDNNELTDAAYTAILDDNTMFGQITPANSMKWVRDEFMSLIPV